MRTRAIKTKWSAAGALLLLSSCTDRSPHLILAQTSIDFGDVERGAPAAKVRLRVTNEGEGDLELRKVSLESPNPELRTGNAEDTTLTQGEMALLQVSYTPADDSTDLNTLVLDTNENDSPHRIPISGHGVTLGASVTAQGASCSSAAAGTSVDFGRVLATQPADREISILSTGTGAIRINQLSFEPDTGEFTADPAQLPGALQPGGSATVRLRYAPRDATHDEVELVLATSAYVTPAVRIPLCGDASIASLCASPASIRFPHVAASTSTSAALRLSSCGNLPLDLTELSVPAGSGFSVSTASALPAHLDPGQAVDATVSFSAPDADAHRATLSVRSTASLAPLTELSLGANLPPACTLQLAPTKLSFYDAATVGDRRVLLANQGNASCSIDALTLHGPFSIPVPPHLPEVVEANEVFSFVLSYRPGPRAQWPESGSLELAYSGAGSDTLQLLLEGNPPKPAGCFLDLAPAAMSFGRTRLGSTGDGSAFVSNVGGADCTLTSIALAPGSDQALIYSGAAAPIQIGSGARFELQVQYHPLVRALAHGSLAVQLGNEGAQSLQVPIFGDTDDPLPPAAEVPNCPEGTSLTYRRHDNPAAPSAIVDPSLDDLFHLFCEDHGCADGQVAVESDPEMFDCTDKPPPCPQGQELDRTRDRWTCTPCTLVIQYGGLFQGLRVCAPDLPPSCGSHESATFDEKMLKWICKPACNGGLYDAHTFQGETVCVPC